MSVVEVTYFPDVLCVWAYVSQARVDAVKTSERSQSHPLPWLSLI
jgi:hypothetical protein